MATNVFCIIGESGSGKNFYLDKILSDKEFVSENNLELLVYGTTRNKRSNEVDGVDYHFYSKESFDMRSKDDDNFLIECRWYDLLDDQKVCYFTLAKFFNPLLEGKNIICTASPDQFKSYENYFRDKDTNVYGIRINVALRKRIESLMERAENDNQLYEMCRRVVNEKEEFSFFNDESENCIGINNTDFNLTENNLDIIKGFIHKIVYDSLK